MTPELTVLALAALLQAIQIGLFDIGMTRDAGLKWNTGPRDRQPDFSPLTGRLRRAVNNHFESLALFTIAAVCISLSGQSSALTAWASWVYLGARILYVPAYAFGWTPWRSVIWGAGFVATMIIILAALF